MALLALPSKEEEEQLYVSFLFFFWPVLARAEQVLYYVTNLVVVGIIIGYTRAKKIFVSFPLLPIDGKKIPRPTDGSTVLLPLKVLSNNVVPPAAVSLLLNSSCIERFPLPASSALGFRRDASLFKDYSHTVTI